MHISTGEDRKLVGCGLSLVIILTAAAIYSYVNVIPNTGPLYSGCKAPCRYHVSGKTFGQVIERYGTPAKMFAVYVPGDERYQIVVVILYYPEMGMTIRAERRDVNTICNVDPNFEVDEVALWKSRTLEDMSKEFQMAHAPEATYLSEWLENWNGYGPITVH